VIYAIFVKDLKLVKWETVETHASHDAPSAQAPTVPPTAPAVAQA